MWCHFLWFNTDAGLRSIPLLRSSHYSGELGKRTRYSEDTPQFTSRHPPCPPPPGDREAQTTRALSSHLYKSSHCWHTHGLSGTHTAAGGRQDNDVTPRPPFRNKSEGKCAQGRVAGRGLDLRTWLVRGRFRFTPTMLLSVNINAGPRFLSKSPARSTLGRIRKRIISLGPRFLVPGEVRVQCNGSLSAWGSWLVGLTQSPTFWPPEDRRHPRGRPGQGERGAWLASPRIGAYLMRMMTEGVCAIAPIMLQKHMTHRKVRKASWHPGLGHFPGTTVVFSGGTVVRHAQPVRF